MVLSPPLHWKGASFFKRPSPAPHELKAHSGRKRQFLAEILGTGATAPGYEIKTAPRHRRPRVRAEIIKKRRFKNTETYEEAVAEFAYRPGACKEPYRMIVLRKKLIVTEGQLYLFDEYRYFFFITNDWTKPATELVLEANQRCDQENLIAQLKGGVGAMTMP